MCECVMRFRRAIEFCAFLAIFFVYWDSLNTDYTLTAKVHHGFHTGRVFTVLSWSESLWDGRDVGYISRRVKTTEANYSTSRLVQIILVCRKSGSISKAKANYGYRIDRVAWFSWSDRSKGREIVELICHGKNIAQR